MFARVVLQASTSLQATQFVWHVRLVHHHLLRQILASRVAFAWPVLLGLQAGHAHQVHLDATRVMAFLAKHVHQIRTLHSPARAYIHASVIQGILVQMEGHAQVQQLFLLIFLLWY